MMTVSCTPTSCGPAHEEHECDMNLILVIISYYEYNHEHLCDDAVPQALQVCACIKDTPAREIHAALSRIVALDTLSSALS